MSDTQIKNHSLYDDTVEISFNPANHCYTLVKQDGEEMNVRWIPSVTGTTSQLDKSAPLIGWAVNMYQEAMISDLDKLFSVAEKDEERVLRESTDVFSYGEIKALIDTNKNAHREVKEKAATIGSIVHEYAETKQDLEQIEGFTTLSKEDKEKVLNATTAFDHWFDEAGFAPRKKEALVYSKKYGFCGTLDLLAVKNRQLHLLDYKTSSGFYVEYIIQVGGYFLAYEEEHPTEKIAGATIVLFCKETGSYRTLHLSRKNLIAASSVFKALLSVKKKLPEINALLPK